MTMTQVPGTYVGQLSRPENLAMLKAYAQSKDKSPVLLVQYYRDIVNALKGTPAWDKPKTNQMINELTYSVRATIAGEKKGRTSAGAHARRMLNKIEYCSKMPARGNAWKVCPLEPILTDEEIEAYLRQAALAA